MAPVSVLSQSVSSPSATTYSQSSSGQNASGFSLSNFNSTASLLVTVGLVNPPAGTTLSITSTTGLSLSTGYSSWSNFTRISFTGTQSNINTALSALKINTSSTPGNVYIAVTATENPAGYYYLPTNGHFYRPMSWPAGTQYTGTTATPYNNIKTLASGQSFKGQTGYLVTITSQDEQNFIQANVPGNNILIALTDKDQEGVWKWDAGPEAGTTIKTTNSGGNVAGQYNNWCSGEPNNWGSGENYTVTKWGGGNCWNDYGPAASSFPGSVSGYVIEFGTWTDPANQTFTDFYTGFVTHQIACSAAQTPSAPAGSGASRSGAGTVTISATAQTGATVDWYTNASGGNPILSNSSTYTTPSISQTTNYYAQARNTTTGCVSSTRTLVKATVIYSTPFSYSGSIFNAEGAPVSGVGVKLYNKLKTSSTYSLLGTYSTNASGNFSISTNLDTATYDFRVVLENLTVPSPTYSDAVYFNAKILTDSIIAKDYYRMNTNDNGNLSITDVYLIFRKVNGANWPTGVPSYRIFSQSEWAAISSSVQNLRSTYPGSQTVTITNPPTGGSSLYYIVITGAKP